VPAPTSTSSAVTSASWLKSASATGSSGKDASSAGLDTIPLPGDVTDAAALDAYFAGGDAGEDDWDDGKESVEADLDEEPGEKLMDADELDVPVEFDALMTDERIKPVTVRPGQVFELAPGKPLRTMAGSGGIVVMDDTTDMAVACARIIRFYAHESCGQCTPCREGVGWLNKVCQRVARGEGRPGDVDLMADIAYGIAGNTICALGEAAAWPMMGFITKFRADFEARIKSAGKVVAA